MKINNMEFLQTSKPVDKDIILMFEKYFSFKLPKEYRKFITELNGGVSKKRLFTCRGNTSISSDIRVFLGFVSKKYYNILDFLKDYSGRIPSNMLPIGYDSQGNLILIAVKMADYGKIYFWDHDREAEDGEEPTYENLTLIADSFDEFINNLKDMKEMGG